MDIGYIITPFFAWLVAGCTKFIINSIKARTLAFDLIGYGGLPSNHSSIVSSTVVLIALREGLQSPALGVAITLAFIVLLDANSLRRQIGKQAEAINRLRENSTCEPLRERIGHSRVEIVSGIFVGAISACIVYKVMVF